MNIKDQMNLLALQEQVINLLIKTKVMETMLIDKGILVVDEYNKKLEESAKIVTDKLQPLIDKNIQMIKEEVEKAKKVVEENPNDKS